MNADKVRGAFVATMALGAMTGVDSLRALWVWAYLEVRKK